MGSMLIAARIMWSFSSVSRANRKSRRIVITGATDGIGFVLARFLAEKGDDLLLVGRRPSFDASFSGKWHYCAADLSRADAAGLVLDAVHGLGWEGIDVLVHNAATAEIGPLENLGDEALARIVAVNLKTPIRLTRVLHPFLEAARGQVVFIGSSSGPKPSPTFAAYAATKHALHGFARSLAAEWQGRIPVSTVVIGPTRTGLIAKSGGHPPWFFSLFASPERSAKRIARALRTRRSPSLLKEPSRAAS